MKQYRIEGELNFKVLEEKDNSMIEDNSIIGINILDGKNSGELELFSNKTGQFKITIEII